VPVPYFLLFLCFRKVTQEIFLKLDKTKAKHPEIYRSFQMTEEEMKRATRRPQNRAAQPRPWPCPLCVRPPRSTSDATPLPIKTPRWEKPKDPINFPETHRDLLPSSTWDQEGPEALPGTLPERGITTGGLLLCHACLRRDEWVVYLGLWVHSSS
jgi:hypothetical protein